MRTFSTPKVTPIKYRPLAASYCLATTASKVLPPRSMVSVTSLSPVWAMAALISVASSELSPFTAVMRSPGSRPAVAAGEPSVTVSMRLTMTYSPTAAISTTASTSASTKFINGPAAVIMSRFHAGCKLMLRGSLSSSSGDSPAKEQKPPMGNARME